VAAFSVLSEMAELSEPTAQLSSDDSNPHDLTVVCAMTVLPHRMESRVKSAIHAYVDFFMILQLLRLVCDMGG
jgi:hypothetical protein